MQSSAIPVPGSGLVFGLGLCGTGLAYLAYYHVVANLGALAASSVTYIPPVVALVIGVLLAGDEINPTGYVAMVLILSGVAMLQFGSRRTEVEAELFQRAESITNERVVTAKAK